MKAPVQYAEQYRGMDAEYLHQQYEELRKPQNENREPKKNLLLLTPFLLSIPVIIILFILISGSAAEIPNTITTEPLQRDVVATKKSERLKISETATDSLVSSSKTIALPAE
jgi:hypothetical protein